MELVVHTPNELSVPGTAEGVREYDRRMGEWSVRHQSSLPGNTSDQCPLVGLDADGTMTTTEGLFRWVKGRMEEGRRPIRFLIGGKDGLESSTLKQCDWSWSLGPLVMNQSIAALVVAEQCYRCYCLRTGHPYHDE